MISSQIMRGREKGWSKKRSFKTFRLFQKLCDLIISLFISKLNNFDPYKNKYKNLSLDKFFILGSKS